MVRTFLFFIVVSQPLLAQDVSVFTQRVAFEDATRNMNIVHDLFENPLENSDVLVLESGAATILSGGQSRTFENRVRKGRFESGVDVTGEFAPTILTISFPQPVVGFGGDWFFALTGDGLTFTIETGSVTGVFQLSDSLDGNGTGFWGVLSQKPFRSVQITGTWPVKGTSEQFSLDDLIFVLSESDLS